MVEISFDVSALNIGTTPGKKHYVALTATVPANVLNVVGMPYTTSLIGSALGFFDPMRWGWDDDNGAGYIVAGHFVSACEWGPDPICMMHYFAVADLEAIAVPYKVTTSLAGNLVEYSLIGAPDGANIDPQTGEFSWTPAPNQTPGTYTFTVRAAHGTVPGLYGEEEVSITVTAAVADDVGVHRGQTWYLDADGSQSWNVPGDDYFSFGIPTDEPIVGDWNGDGYDEVGVHRGDRWYLDYDGNGQWNVPGDQYFRFGIPGDEPVVGRWLAGAAGASQSAGGGNTSFASGTPTLAAEPGMALAVGLLPESIPTATRAAQVDGVFATVPGTLPAEPASSIQLGVDTGAGQVTRCNRLGSGGLLDLPASKVSDQALEELLQSLWWPLAHPMIP